MKLKDLSEIKHGWALFLIDFILPLPLTALMLFLWYIRTNNWLFSLYVLMLPLLFGYIIPGIGTNILKLWAFKWKFMRIGDYFIHHGFMYAPYFALSLYLTFGNAGAISLVQAATIVISNSFLQCFLTTLHDYMGVKSGMIEINNRPFREGKSAAEIILDYGPIGYALFGCTYAISCLAAYQYLFKSLSFPFLTFLLLIILGLLLMGLSGVNYVFRERKRARI
jgi:hypothetical protein